MTFGRFCCYPIWIVGLLSTFVEKYNIPIAPIRSPNDFIRVVNLWLFHGVSCLWGKIISPRAIKQMSSNKLGSLEHYYQKHISDLETPTLEDVLCFFLALWHMSFMYVFFCLRGGGGVVVVQFWDICQINVLVCNYIITGWWFQPLRKILVKMGIFPK